MTCTELQLQQVFDQQAHCPVAKRYLASKKMGALCDRSEPLAVVASKADRSRLRMSSLSILF